MGVRVEYTGTTFTSEASKQNAMKTLGILLIVIGAIMTVFTGFNLVTQEEVVDVGPVEINKEEKTPIYWSPVTGAILLVAGVVIVATSRKSSRA